MNSLLIGGAIGAAVIIAAFTWHQIDRKSAYAEGQRSERLIWQERQARDYIAYEKALKQSQKEISRIEADYWRQSSAHQDQVNDLREELEREKLASAPGDGCPPAASKRVRDKLNAIGRD